MNKKQRVLLLLGLNFLAQLLAGIYASQKIADILSYQPALYGSLSWFGFPHLYFPFIWISWYFSYGKEAAWIFDTYAFNPAMYALGGAMLLGCLIIARNSKIESVSHGSAHFATEEEIVEYSYDPDGRTGWEKLLTVLKFLKQGNFSQAFGDNRHRNDNDLFCGKGVFLGRLDNGKYIRDNSKTHILICAPTRSGKGVGHIVPTLLAWEGSTIVTDIKGENWELTAGFRKYKLGNDVFMFKPTSRESCHYNPLDEIRIGTPYEMNDLQLITKILVDPTGKGGDGNNAHWVNNAWDLLQGVVLHLLYAKRFHNGNEPPRTANLSDVLDFLYDGQGSEGKEFAEKAKAIKKKFEEDARLMEDYEKTTECRITSVDQALAVADNLKNDDNSSNSDSSDSASDSADNAKVYKLFSPLKQYSGSLNSFCNDDEFFDFDDGEDEFVSPSDNIQPGSLMKQIAADEEKRKALAEEMPEIKVDVNKVLLMANVDPDNVTDLDEEEYKKTLSEESETLSGLQKKFQTYITNFDGNNHGYRHAPDGKENDDFFVKLYPDKVNRDGLHPHVRQLFQSMVDKPDKEFGSILSTLNTALILYRNPIIVDNIRDSDFVMKDLMDCKKPISLYLVFGPGEMDVVRPLLRVVVDMLWRLNVEEMKFSDGKAEEHQHRLLLLLDEFPALGKMDGFAISEGFIAGYGMKACIITQDLNQINNIYGKDNYVVSNCQVQVYHTPSDNNSAKYLSDKLGNQTIESTSSSRNSNILPMPTSYNDSLMSRPLMYPNEVSTMDPSKLLVFCKGLAPIYCNKIRYFEDPVFLPRTKIKPPVFSDIVAPSDRRWNISDYHSLMDAKKAAEENKK